MVGETGKPTTIIIALASELQTKLHGLPCIRTDIHRETVEYWNLGVAGRDIWKGMQRTFLATEKHAEIVAVIEKTKRLSIGRNIASLL